MRRTGFQLLLLVAVALLVACGGKDSPSSSGIQRTTAALQSGGVVPIPCNGSGEPKWGGTAVDLLVADAMVACSAHGSEETWSVYREGGGSTHNPYLIYVRGLMADAEGDLGLALQLNSEGELPTWKTLRGEQTKNCDPTTLESDATVDATLQPKFIPYLFPVPPLPYTISCDDHIERANVQLRTPAFHLCLAQTIRELIPGSSATATILLSEADQRSVLEIVREFAQISMLSAAANGVAFSSQSVDWPTNLQPSTHYLPFLKYWAQLCGDDPQCVEESMKNLGRDFAAAVQLHSVVSEELANLLARSRSARTERGGDAESRADEMWGSGSWHQRLLAAMAGGDPLANADLDPWQRPSNDGLAERFVLFDTPGPWTSSRWIWPPTETFGHDWPSAEQTPYVATDISEPQVQLLFNLAKSFDRIHLAYRPYMCFFDTEQTADDLYGWIEAEVRKEACYHQVGGQCSDLVELPSAPFPDETYLLWERYRIHPSHAETLAQYLTENVKLRELGLSCLGGGPDPDHRTGGQNLSGRVVVEAHPTVSERQWLHITNEPPEPQPGAPEVVVPDVSLLARPLADIAPAYSRNAVQRFPAPWDLDAWAPAATQGFTGACPLDESLPYCVEMSLDSQRLMGAMPAMAATRMMLMSSIAMLKTQYAGEPQADRLDDYFAHAEDILRVLDGSIGADSVAVRPQISRQTDPDTDQEVLVVDEGADGHRWRVDVSYPASGDAFWARDVGAQHRLCAIAHPAAGNLAMTPASILLGDTVDDLMAEAEDLNRCSDGIYWEDQPGALHQSYDGAPNGWTAPDLWLPAAIEDDPSSTVFTLVAKRTTSSEEKPSYRLLGSSIAFGFTSDPGSGQYLAYGGSLGTRLARAIEGRPDNPTVHRYDGFDLSSNWVPPFTAELIGGSAGQSSVERYIALAQSSSEEATAAVADAMDVLLAEQVDDAAMAAATVRAQEGIKEEQEKLCGSANPECNIQVVRMKPSWSWFFESEPVWVPCTFTDPDSLASKQCWVDDLAYQLTTPSLYMELDLARPVLDMVDAPAAPSFSGFAGGALQSAFIEQWRAIRAIREEIRKVQTAAKAAKEQIELAYTILEDDANWTVARECDSGRLMQAYDEGISQSCEKIYWQIEGDNQWHLKCHDPQGASYSNGPYLAQKQACEDAIAAQENPMPSQQQAVVVVYLEAMSAVASAAGQMLDAQTRLHQSNAQVASLLLNTKLAKSRHELERELAAIQQTTSFGLYRRYRSYDLWRAKAMVDNARMYALAARRAIEARYVVDLSTLTQPEAFVQSPATWADEVYDYDLSLPSAVGLTVGTASEDGIYPNKVRDYVGNLESFVMGYAANRPAAVASKEIDVVNLKGLKPGEPVELPLEEGTVYADMGEWMLHCPETATLSERWIPVPRDCPASEACFSDPFIDIPTFDVPDRARMEFTLDPWGRLNDSVANEPYERRFNGRWDLMAVNFAGTGIKDCDDATDPYACYSEGFVRYSLSHVGPAWVTDYDGIWRTLGVPIGRIEGAKGLASELWLDPLKDGWNTTYISAVSRTELQLRPLGGAYELEFVITPEIDIDRIERVQLLIGSTYWVKQD